MTEDQLDDLVRTAKYRFPTFVERFGEHILAGLVEAEVEAVEQLAGSPDAAAQSFIENCSRVLSLSRPAASVTSVTEARSVGGDQVTLGAGDYRQIDEFRLVRLADGANPASSWGQEVTVAFVPISNTSLRERVVLDLVRLDIDFRTASRQQVAELVLVDGDYASKRRELLSQVTEGAAILF
jgi:hypothetical protein